MGKENKNSCYKKENMNSCYKKKNKRSGQSVLSSITRGNVEIQPLTIPMTITPLEEQQPPVRSKKEIYQVNDNKNVGVLVECDNCGFVDESTRPKSKSSSSSSQDEDEDITATKSSEVASIITYYFKCPNCSAEKTVLEHEQNDNDEDEEDEETMTMRKRVTLGGLIVFGLATSISNSTDRV